MSAASPWATRTAAPLLPTCFICGCAYKPRWINNKPGATLSLYCSVACSRQAKRLGGKTSDLPWLECQVCGSSFMNPPRPRKDGRLARPSKWAKFCSAECRSRSRSAECGHCGKTFHYYQAAKPREYCSPKCQNRARRLRIPCLWCGRLHLPGEVVHRHRVGGSFARGRSLCCSLRCTTNIKVWFGRTSPLPWEKCEVCGETFYGRHGRKYCSEQCWKHTYRTEERLAVQREHARDRAKRNYVAPEPFECAECGAGVVPEYGDMRRVYCGDTCRARAVGRSTKHARRARIQSGTVVEKVALLALLERDGWRCGICRERIRKTANYPDPMSPSVDHIIPLAAGGEHSYRNTQPAHWICNSRKSDGLAASQTRLF